MFTLLIALTASLSVKNAYKDCGRIQNRWDCFGAAGDEGVVCSWIEPKKGKSAEESCFEGEGSVEEMCAGMWDQFTCEESRQCVYDTEDGKCTMDESAGEGEMELEEGVAFDCTQGGTATALTCNRLVGQGQACGWDAFNNVCSLGYPLDLSFQCRKFGTMDECNARADLFCAFNGDFGCTTTYSNAAVPTMEPEEIEAEGPEAEQIEHPETEFEHPEVEGEGVLPVSNGGVVGGNTGFTGAWGSLQFMDANARSVWNSVSGGTFNGILLSGIGQPMTYSTQVVNGVNYKFLFADGRTVTVYQTPGGACSVSDVTTPTHPTGVTSGTSSSTTVVTVDTETNTIGTETEHESEITGTEVETESNGTGVVETETEVETNTETETEIVIPTNLDQGTQDAIAADEAEVVEEIEAGEAAAEIAEDQQEVQSEIDAAETELEHEQEAEAEAAEAAAAAHEEQIEAMEEQITEDQQEVQAEIDAGEAASEIAEDQQEVQNEIAEEQKFESEAESPHLRSTHGTTSNDEEFFKKGFYFLLGVVSTLAIGGLFRLWQTSRGKFGRESIELDQSHLLV